MRKRMQGFRRSSLLAALALVLVLALGACAGLNTPVQPATQETGGEEAVAETSADESTPTPEAEAEVAPPELNPEEGSAGSVEPAQRDGFYASAPEMTIDPEKVYFATLKTEKGDIRVQLFADQAPMTVNNFIFLAREGYYDNTSFHRVLEEFMAQAGDPTGTGAGGPGYQFGDEIVPELFFDKPGQLAMANAGPGTNGSQFFITFVPTPWLDGRHTIFGQVVEGLEVLDSLTRRDPGQAPDGAGDTLFTVEIEELEQGELPTATPLPPTPTPFPPSSMAPEDLTAGDRPLAALSLEERSNYFSSPPEMVIDTANTYRARIVTSAGDMLVTLYDDEAPTSVNNFVLLAALGFYDGTPINDVAPEQALIFGAPANVPTSSSGYRLEADLGVPIAMDIGAIAYLPNPDPQTGQPLSNGSQLLVALVAPPPEAGMQLAFFGQIEEGVELLSELTTEDTIEMITIEVEPAS